MTRRWIVREGDGRTVSEVVTVLEGGRAAVDEGRVFLGRRRVLSGNERVCPGEEVTVKPRASAAAGVKVLAERHGVYAVGKPEGLPTEPDQHGGRSVVRWLAELLGVDPRTLHAATRLDSMVTGIVLVARGPEATRAVTLWQQQGLVRKRYLGLALGSIEPESGAWTAPIGRGPRGEPSIAGRAARPAETRYAVVETLRGSVAEGVSLVSLSPTTGRLHQLRLHLAHSGAPLLGDVRHGGPRQVVLRDGRVVVCPRPLLHAGSVEVALGDGAWRVDDAPPSDLSSVWGALGGDPSAFDRALLAPRSARGG